MNNQTTTEAKIKHLLAEFKLDIESNLSKEYAFEAAMVRVNDLIREEKKALLEASLKWLEDSRPVGKHTLDELKGEEIVDAYTTGIEGVIKNMQYFIKQAIAHSQEDREGK